MMEVRRCSVVSMAYPAGCRWWRRIKVFGPEGDVTVRGTGHQRKARLRNRPLKRGWARQASDRKIMTRPKPGRVEGRSGCRCERR